MMKVSLIFLLFLAQGWAEEWVHLGMSASKLIKLQYQGKYWLDEKKGEGSLKIEQALRANIKGNVKERVYVDVDYNDKREQQQKVVLSYKGREGEVVKEAAFGDIYLHIPATEFLGYGKHLFGARASFSLGRATLQTIFSRTKGFSKRKEFLGKAYQRIEQIKDSSFIRLRYFALKEGIKEGSEKIYFDDKDASNNLSTQKGSALGLPKEGDFDTLLPEQDYILDYKEGVLRMRKNVDMDDVIIIKCTLSGGGEWVQVIKDDRTEPDYDGADKEWELCSFYTLGYKRIDIFDEDFIIEIRDERDSTKYNGVSYIQIFGLDADGDGRVDEAFFDEDFGLLHFPDPTPFDLTNEDSKKNPYWSLLSEEEKETLSNPDIYKSYYASSRYTIHVEYKDKVEEYFLEPDVVEGSERVYVDGRLLRRGRDYIIDYQSGWITFLVPIEEETKILVEYECSPLFGGGQANLFGARATMPLGPLRLGSTYIMEESPRLREVPGIFSAPEGLRVFGMDASMQKRLGPIEFKVAAELASSMKNPNIMEEAYIDDMKQSIVQLLVPTNKGSWQPAAVPTTGRGILLFEGKKSGPYFVEQEVEEEKREVVAVKFYTRGGESVAIVHPLSRNGEDLSRYEELHLLIKGEDLSKYDIYIDLGIVNEDADGDGALDTEDGNADGLLNPGEDIGWMMGERCFGAENMRLDKEDLDGDGELEKIEGYFTVKLSPEQRSPEDGYSLYKIKLPQFLKQQNWPTQREKLSPIKCVRMRIKTKEEGEYLFYILSLKFLASRWKAPKLEEPNYLNISLVEEEEERLLLLQFCTQEWEFVERSFPHSMNLSLYKGVRIEREGELPLCVRIGSSSKDYFEYICTEESIVLLQPQRKVGNPRLSHIKYMALGVKGEGEEKIKGVLVALPRLSRGTARKLSLQIGAEKISCSFVHKDVDEEFRSVGKTSPHQAQKLTEISASINLIKKLPIDIKGGREETFSTPLGAPELVKRKHGRRRVQSYQICASFLHRGQRKVKAFYSREDVHSLRESKREEERQRFNVSAEHELIRRKKISLSLSGKYAQPLSITKTEGRKDYREDRIQDVTAKLRLSPTPSLTKHLLLGYGARYIKKVEGGDFFLQQRTAFLSVDFDYRGGKRFSTTADSSINYRESMKEASKDVYTQWQVGARLKVRPFTFLKPVYSFKMRLSADYTGLKKEALTQTAKRVFWDYYKNALFGRIKEGALFLHRKRACVDCTHKVRAHFYIYKPLSLWSQIMRHWRKTQTMGSCSFESTWRLRLNGRCNILQIKEGWRKKLDSLYLLADYTLTKGRRAQYPLKKRVWEAGLQWGWARKWNAELHFERGKEERIGVRKYLHLRTSLLYRSIGPKRVTLLWAKRQWVQEFEVRCALSLRKEEEKVQRMKKMDKSIYKMDISADYRLSSNLYLTLSADLGYNKDALSIGKNHYSYGVGVQLQLCF